MPRYPKGMDVHSLPGPYHSGRVTKSQMEWTANKLLKGAGAGADPTEIDPPSAIYFPNSEVWDGTSNTPTSFTDLNLSSVVGSNKAWVLLEVYRTGNDCGYFQVRPNGETVRFDGDITRGDIFSQNYKYSFLCRTDASGLVEWFTNVAVTDVHIIVTAYIK